MKTEALKTAVIVALALSLTAPVLAAPKHHQKAHTSPVKTAHAVVPPTVPVAAPTPVPAPSYDTPALGLHHAAQSGELVVTFYQADRSHTRRVLIDAAGTYTMEDRGRGVVLTPNNKYFAACNAVWTARAN